MEIGSHYDFFNGGGDGGYDENSDENDDFKVCWPLCSYMGLVMNSILQ